MHAPFTSPLADQLERWFLLSFPKHNPDRRSMLGDLERLWPDNLAQS
jgi:hypothetical protein